VEAFRPFFLPDGPQTFIFSQIANLPAFPEAGFRTGCSTFPPSRGRVRPREAGFENFDAFRKKKEIKLRTLLKKWRSEWSAAPPAQSSGMGGPISLRLQGGLVRSAERRASLDTGENDRAWDFEVVVARPGYSRDGKWFLTPGVLREAAPLFEGTQAFANHAPPEGPDTKDLVGWHQDV